MSTGEAYIIWQKPITACKIQCQLPSRGWLKLPWSMCVAMWDVEHSLAMASLNIYKTTLMNEMQSLKKYNWFEIENKTEDRGQSIPKFIGTLTVLRCIFGQNLEILTLISSDLTRTNSWADWRTDAGKDNTRRPKLASGLKKKQRSIDMNKWQYQLYQSSITINMVGVTSWHLILWSKIYQCTKMRTFIERITVEIKCFSFSKHFKLSSRYFEMCFYV